VPSEVAAAVLLCGALRGLASRVELGQQWCAMGRGGRYLEELYTPAEQREQWSDATAAVVADPMTAHLAAAAGDDLSQFLQTAWDGGGDSASNAVVQVWLDIAHNHRVDVLVRQVARRCGVSNGEAEAIVNEVAEIAVSSAYHTLKYGMVPSCVSRSDEDGILEALRASTVDTAWTDNDDFAWRSVLPLLSR
jgi:hypothetical protein